MNKILLEFDLKLCASNSDRIEILNRAKHRILNDVNLLVIGAERPNDLSMKVRTPKERLAFISTEREKPISEIDRFKAHLSQDDMKFLKWIENKISFYENRESATDEAVQVTPESVAKELKGRDRSNNDTYSEKNIAFALQKFSDHYDKAKRYKEIFRIIKGSKGCPECLKEEKAYKRELEWFRFYEEKSGITLT